MNDEYSWWRRALEMSGGRELSRDQMQQLGVSETDPRSGFFRTRRFKDGPFVPMAIWRDESQRLFCLVDGKEADAERYWAHACRCPITEATYHAVSGGQPWPDEPPAPKDHNQVKTGDPHIDLSAEFTAEKELAEAFLRKAITTQHQADQAAIWAKRLAAIAKKATDLHKVEKQPSLDEGRRVDDKWRDLREGADALSKTLKRHMDAFLKEQDRIEQERQRKAREEADRIRREAAEAEQRAAEAARKAEEEKSRRDVASPDIASRFEAETQREADRLDAEHNRLSEQAKAAEREAQARNTTAGRTGSKVALRTFYDAEITDYDALVIALKDEPEVRDVITKIANRIARTQGAAMPVGATRVDDRRAA